jgi:uncharacterized damage-inducible protein DinB
VSAGHNWFRQTSGLHNGEIKAMQKTYRNGAIGALMDEYERAAADLIRVVQPLSSETYSVIRDPKTQDENCRSIQTIMSHVVSAGYSYANYIRKPFSIPVEKYEKRPLSHEEAISGMYNMLHYTVNTLKDHWIMSDEEIMNVHIQTDWGPRYDVEQLLEHAIVHILRHRRQIDRWIQNQ